MYFLTGHRADQKKKKKKGRSSKATQTLALFRNTSVCLEDNINHENPQPETAAHIGALFKSHHFPLL